jgi:hypothetical protein
VFKSVQVVFRRIGQVYAKRRPTLGAPGEFQVWPRAGRYLLQKFFGYASLQACSRGEMPIGQNQASPQVALLVSSIITCDPAHPAPNALRAYNGSFTHACTLEAMRTREPAGHADDMTQP